MAQSTHGAFEFSVLHPGLMRLWMRDSNYLVVLQVADEAELLQWSDQAFADGTVDFCLVKEPDLDGQATALVLGPSADFHRHLAHLSLAGKELAMT